MPDPGNFAFEPIQRPALDAAKPLASARISLAPLPEGTVIQLFGPVGRADELREGAKGAGLSTRYNGPGQWFLVGDDPVHPAHAIELMMKLPNGFTAIDQSHGRVRIAIEGNAVEEMLAKGTGIDLALVETGQAATTLIGHVATHLTRISGDRFELLVTRSFAESVWDDLKMMAAEYLGPSNE